MRIHPLHLRPLRPGRVTVVGPEAHHLIRVLRVAPGARLRAFDGAGLEADASVVAVEGSRLEVEVDPPRPGECEAATELTLATALLKGDKMATVVRTGTELGVARFQLLLCRRCEVRRPSPAKLERLARIAREAAKQAGRSFVPEVAAPIPLERLASAPAPDTLTLVAHPGAADALAGVLGGTRPAPVVVASGPEGGFEPDEVALLTSAGWRAVHLGPRVLRAETAPLALAALLLLGAG